MRIFFLIALSVASLGTQALTVVPSRHLVCEKYPGTMVDKECNYVPGGEPDLGFKLEPSDPKEVMSITKDINGWITIERRDGAHETFRPDGMGGWQRQ